MQTLDESTNIYLIPASSPEDEKLIELCLKSGLDLETVKDLEFPHVRGHSDSSDKVFYENEDENLGSVETDKQDIDKSDINRQKYEQNITNIEEKAVDNFRYLRENSSQKNTDGVYCWPVDQTHKTQHQFNKGDLLLFYTGNGFYKYAGIFEKEFSLPHLGKLLLLNPSRDRSNFLELSNVSQIQIDSSVMADLTGRDLESVQKISPLSGAVKEEIVNQFGSLSDFITEAQSGINTLLPYSDQDTSDVWETTESPSGDSTAAESSAEISDSSAVERTPKDQPVESGPTETVKEDPTSILKPEEESKAEWQQLANQLHQSKQVVLVGAQGTGKRRVVADLVSNWLEERGRVSKQNRIVRTQFTKSTDYSEFVLGQYGDSSADDQLVQGPFGEFIDIAAAEAVQFIGQDYDSPPKYVMVIEGFQNVNIPEVFGEFYQALRPRNRGPQQVMDVSGVEASLWVPEEVYIIGIADVHDLNAETVRNTIGSPFDVQHKTPNYDILYDLYDYSENGVLTAARDGELEAQSILALEALNQYLEAADESTSTHLIGHMYLSKGTTELRSYDSDEILRGWQYDILPTLAGFFDQGLEALEDGPIENVHLDGSQMSLGTFQSNPTHIEKIIESLAKSHPEY